MVVQALFDYRATAQEIFRAESDLVADIGEDITREALDRLGMPCIDQRLFGKVDYKTTTDNIWSAGRNAPTLGEEFRVRLSMARLKAKAAWRVQQIPMPPADFAWDG